MEIAHLNSFKRNQEDEVQNPSPGIRLQHL